MAAVLAMPESNPRRAKVLARLEGYSKAAIGKDGKSVDWAKVSPDDILHILEILGPIILKILALFGL